MDGTSAALSDSASKFRADEFEMIAQNPQEWGLGSHVHGAGLAVNLEGELSHGNKLVGWGSSRKDGSQGLTSHLSGWPSYAACNPVDDGVVISLETPNEIKKLVGEDLVLFEKCAISAAAVH